VFVSAEPAATIVRLDGQFGPRQVSSLEALLAMFRPVRHLVIDFAAVRDVDAAAIAQLAHTLDAFSESRVSFQGLPRHLRRVLRYIGVDVEGSAPQATERA
jgi:anti-anti-sigma regulatory factor